MTWTPYWFHATTANCCYFRFSITDLLHPGPALNDSERTAVKGCSRKTVLTVMVSRRESPAMLAAQDVGFRSVAAQELGFTGIGGRGHSNATSMKRKRTMRRRNGMGVGRHRDKDKPTKRFVRSKEAHANERLFPGIPDEISWDLIVPKLSWRALPALSSVSRAWKEAIRTNRVYEERVRANLLETLIIHDHGEAIALFSTSENCCYELPPVPRLPRAALQFCKCIASGGKIYILGGREVSGRKRVLEGGHDVRDSLVPHEYNASGKVYVLDLGRGLWQWEQCSSMLEPRYAFACGVIDDKIYVFGGRTSVPKEGGTLPILHRSEVYDTQENAWSSIMPKRPEIFIPGCETSAPFGKELFLYHRLDPTVGVYNSAKDEWRLERFWEHCFKSVVFITEGKFYSFSQSGIAVYDVKQKSWINRHTHSFAAFRPDGFAEFQPLSVLAVKDELFLTAYWKNCPQLGSQSFHCKGFDSEKKELVWQNTKCPFRLCHGRLVQFPIQL